MKRLFITFFLFCLVMLMSVASYASTLTVSIDGLENLNNNDNIWSYQMEWSINTDDNLEVAFDEENQHLWEVAPDVFIVNWILQCNYIEEQEKLVILAWEKDLGKNSPLVNGELFTITYSNDTNITLIMESFLLTSDRITPVTVINEQLPITFTSNDKNLNLTISAVPIPTTLLLLGSGLIGLIGLRRKQMNK